LPPAACSAPRDRSTNRSAGRSVAFEAGDNPHGGLMDVLGQIFRRVEPPQKSLPVNARAGSPDDAYLLFGWSNAREK
jgi:hypothetical protein